MMEFLPSGENGRYGACFDDMARWSSGYDGGLSRRKHEFDSRTGHHSKANYGSLASTLA